MGRKWKTIEPGVWKPQEEEDSIEGVLVNKVARDENNNLSAKYYIDNKEGMFLVWGSAILEDRMQYVKVGELVRITYHGQDTNKKGQKINLYKVEVAEAEDASGKDKPEEEPVAVEDIGEA